MAWMPVRGRRKAADVAATSFREVWGLGATFAKKNRLDRRRLLWYHILEEAEV